VTVPRPGTRTVVALLVLMPWLAWAVVRTFGIEGDLGTRVVPAMAFTPYVAGTAVVPLIVALPLRRRLVAAVGVVVVIAFALAVLPRAFAGPRPTVTDGVPVTVMTSNLFEGRGDARTIVDLVRRHHVDVLALEELTADAVTRLDAAGLRRLMPYRDVDTRPQFNASGTGLFSRRPIRRLDPFNSLNRNAEPRALVTVPGAPDLEVQTVHPPPPIHGWNAIWTQMLGELPKPGRDAASPRMLIGDFNATLDHEQLRRLLGDGGYVDAADATGEGFRTTWPAGRHFPPELTIDHVLVDRRIRPQDVTVNLVPRSDHRAVIADLELPRTAR
jgi:endonuclease/exonuclease/phosphatase family metal-dependent hydrolase